MLRDTTQHIRGKVLLDCAGISIGARTETSMTEGARERKAQDTPVLNLLRDINIPTSILSFLSSQTGIRVATKKHLTNSLWAPLLYLGCCLCKARSQAKEKHSGKHEHFFSGLLHTFRVQQLNILWFPMVINMNHMYKCWGLLIFLKQRFTKKKSNTWSCTCVRSLWWDPQQPPLYPWLWPCSGTDKNNKPHRAGVKTWRFLSRLPNMQVQNRQETAHSGLLEGTAPEECM